MLHFKRVVIVGVGLLGGSLGMALRQRRLADTIIGFGRHEDALREAQALGAITDYELDLEQACRGAELAVICTPVQQVAGYVEHCCRAMGSHGLVTDVGSTKQTIVEAIPMAARGNFCGSHPLAGSDKSGVGHADANLFEGKLTIVTPVADTPAETAEANIALWHALGCRTLRMDPEIHDQALAQTSHLPHIVAAGLAGITPSELLPLAASGWCDTTRVASGNVELWRQIIRENRASVLTALRQFSRSLDGWLAAIESEDDAELTQLLQIGKQKRDSVGN